MGALGRVFRWVAAVGCTAIGIWLLLPGRNVAGNPAFERELQHCQLPDGDLVRLYEGNGGATTAFWYTVTHDGGWLSRERQILYSYGVPEVKEITCGSDSIGLTFWDGAVETQETLALDRVRRKLRSQPITLQMGERFKATGNPFRILMAFAGLVFVGVGLGLVPWRHWRHLKALKEPGSAPPSSLTQ